MDAQPLLSPFRRLNIRSTLFDQAAPIHASSISSQATVYTACHPFVGVDIARLYFPQFSNLSRQKRLQAEPPSTVVGRFAPKSAALCYLTWGIDFSHEVQASVR